MALRLGGPIESVQAVKAAGGIPGPASTWLTAGVENWGLGYLDTFFADCKRDGLTPLVKAWIWGDAISTAAIKYGVNDLYQKNKDGSRIFITKAKALGWLRTMAQKAQAAGISPIVAIEHEFAQNGLETDSSAFGPYFNEAVAVIKGACQSARIAFCCPIWEDEVAIAKVYATQIARSDLISSQALLFLTQHPASDFTGIGAALTKAIANLRLAAPGKPACIVDMGFSSYGGAYSKTPPFAGGDGRANDALQASAIKAVADAAPGMGLEFIVIRDLKDDPNFNVANFGGYAERHIGVIRADGSRKPAYDSLMALARPPEPKTRTESEYLAVIAQRDGYQRDRNLTIQKVIELRLQGDHLQARIEMARTSVNAAQAALNGP